MNLNLFDEPVATASPIPQPIQQTFAINWHKLTAGQTREIIAPVLPTISGEVTTDDILAKAGCPEAARQSGFLHSRVLDLICAKGSGWAMARRVLPADGKPGRVFYARQ